MTDRNPFDNHDSEESRIAELREMDRNAASWRRAETRSGRNAGKTRGRWINEHQE